MQVSVATRGLKMPDLLNKELDYMLNKEFDYIVIGSGIGGSVVANRLSANPAAKVLLLEAGPPDDDSDIHHVELNSLFSVWQKPQLDWGFSTLEEPGLDGRKMPMLQGKVAGGAPPATLPCSIGIFLPSRPGSSSVEKPQSSCGFCQTENNEFNSTWWISLSSSGGPASSNRTLAAGFAESRFATTLPPMPLPITM